MGTTYEIPATVPQIADVAVLYHPNHEEDAHRHAAKLSKNGFPARAIPTEATLQGNIALHHTEGLLGSTTVRAVYGGDGTNSMMIEAGIAAGSAAPITSIRGGRMGDIRRAQHGWPWMNIIPPHMLLRSCLVVQAHTMSVGAWILDKQGIAEHTTRQAESYVVAGQAAEIADCINTKTYRKAPIGLRDAPLAVRTLFRRHKGFEYIVSDEDGTTADQNPAIHHASSIVIAKGPVMAGALRLPSRYEHPHLAVEAAPRDRLGTIATIGRLVLGGFGSDPTNMVKAWEMTPQDPVAVSLDGEPAHHLAPGHPFTVSVGPSYPMLIRRDRIATTDLRQLPRISNS